MYNTTQTRQSVTQVHLDSRHLFGLLFIGYITKQFGLQSTSKSTDKFGLYMQSSESALQTADALTKKAVVDTANDDGL